MHIIIGIITAIAGLIWAISSLRKTGFSFSSLNPFAWYRRNKWKQLYNTKPIYGLTDPVDVAAVLLLGIAKCEGEISAEQKRAILIIFESEFHLTGSESSDLLLASSHMIKDELYLVDNLNKLFSNSQSRFTEKHISSLLSLMKQVANLEGHINDEQLLLINATEHYFKKTINKDNTWKSS